MKSIPQDYLDLTVRPAFAHLVTLMPDGSPQVSPVWWEYADGYVIVNSAEGRLKDRNMRRDPRVALSVLDPDNPYRYLQIRGRVVEITTEGGDALIDRLAKKYLGLDSYPYRTDTEIRVIYKITPEAVSAQG